MFNDTIYYNGTIYSMDREQPVEAVMVRDGKIHAVGPFDEIMGLKTANTSLVNLRGKTMMPAFIDPHSHITALASTLRTVPLSGLRSFEEIISALQDYLHKTPLKENDWLIGFGYDHNALREGKHPTREILDRVSTDCPIIITHASGHMGAMNSRGLKEAGISANTPNPQGGLIGRDGSTGEPNGYLEEKAFMEFSSMVPTPTLEEMSSLLEKAQEVYFSHGITTIQEGIIRENEFHVLNYAAQSKRLKADIIGYVDCNQSKFLAEKHPEYVKRYQNRFKIGGYKIFLDGSPQGKTAWLTKPYCTNDDGYCGYPIYSDEQVIEFCRIALQENLQLLAHCNGDAAADQFIRSMETAQKEFPTSNIRPVMIHAQAVRRDQLDRMKKAGIIPSFFVAHTYYWGDTHLKNLGKERAMAISPAGSTWKQGMIFTFHQDTPVLPPDMLDTLWCAVNRRTRADVTIGEEEKIPVKAACTAVTINAAYQYFEERSKGTITPGKQADLVVLDRDPLLAAPDTLRNIKVLATIKAGEVVYKRN